MPEAIIGLDLTHLSAKAGGLRYRPGLSMNNFLPVYTSELTEVRQSQEEDTVVFL